MKTFPIKTIFLTACASYSHAFTSHTSRIGNKSPVFNLKEQLAVGVQPQQLTSSIVSSILSSSSSSSLSASSAASSSESSSSPAPKSFREAEVLGLRLMQDGRHDDALSAFKQAMSLPGSRPDIIRTANVSGPSPVGGAKGGTEGRFVQNLDEFELQAAHYNVACAHACLGNVGESVANLKKAFDYGFDNYATVRADPDLSNVQSTTDFERLMEQYDPKKGFNPFGVFGK